MLREGGGHDVALSRCSGARTRTSLALRSLLGNREGEGRHSIKMLESSTWVLS